MEGTGSLAVELAIGLDGGARTAGWCCPWTDSLIGGCALSPAGRPGRPSAGRRTHDADGSPAGAPRGSPGSGPAVAVPIGTGGRRAGRASCWSGRRAGRSFTEKETEPLQGFAAQAAVAMELAERRSDAEQIALLEDRDRIARDLHDLAIQRLFATGMTLQSAGRFIDHPEASERVLRAVDDLDETIKIIRSTIFGLRARDGAGRTGPARPGGTGGRRGRAGAGLRARPAHGGPAGHRTCPGRPPSTWWRCSPRR